MKTDRTEEDAIQRRIPKKTTSESPYNTTRHRISSVQVLDNREEGFRARRHKYRKLLLRICGMNSLNHYAFGSVGEYLFGMIGGIQPDAPGYKRIRIEPVVREGLTWARTSYDSIHGKIVSNWKREGDQLTMEVTIPPNTTATIHVPARDATAVTEGGKTIDRAKGVKFLRTENSAAVYGVGSGTYRFQTTLTETTK